MYSNNLEGRQGSDLIQYSVPWEYKLTNKQTKKYGCFFTCFYTRAIHGDMLDTLEVDSFINCIRRYIARRGYSDVLFSDNVTNFVGAYKQMTKAQQETMQHVRDQQRIQWKLIPPRHRITEEFGKGW